jgi:hypothetical protein
LLAITDDMIDRVLGLFSPSNIFPDHPHEFVNAFETLGSSLRDQVMMLAMAKHENPSILQQARLFQYATFRLQGLLARLVQLRWTTDHFRGTRSDDEKALWRLLSGLIIKDFHNDLGSLMDSLAPAILQVSDLFEASGETKLPGFADIQEGTQRAYRKKLPEPILKIVDTSNDWWPEVKSVRDTLIHREHHQIVYGTPELGLLFQIYDPPLTPRILDANIKWIAGNKVADFSKYSAVVLCHLFLFLDDLGKGLSVHLGVPLEGVPPPKRCGDFTDLIDAIRSLHSSSQADS